MFDEHINMFGSNAPNRVALVRDIAQRLSNQLNAGARVGYINQRAHTHTHTGTGTAGITK